MSGGGCIWNDTIDRDLDAKVERTRNRPLAAGRMSVLEALAFLSVHVIALFYLCHLMNDLGWWIGFCTTVPLTGLYPFMKRITYWPQVWLGVTLSAPVLLGSAVFVDAVSRAVMVLMAGGVSWVMWYDTIYACQDKKDDEKAGVKSITLVLHRYIRATLLIFAWGVVSSWLASGLLSGAGITYFLISVAGGAALLLRGSLSTDLDDPRSCLAAFESNGFLIGPIVFLGILLDYLVPITKPHLPAFAKFAYK
ncbi:hypothetical protein APHAL10511_008040 [Amanita phalloides]|nr:hypothetical protein APHAL10511_008040 [Amanita phalloides]